MTLGKVDRVAEFHHFAEEIGAMAEALQNAGHLLTARLGAPFVVDLGYFSRRIAIFDELDPGVVVGGCHVILRVVFSNIAREETGSIRPWM